MIIIVRWTGGWRKSKLKELRYTAVKSAKLMVAFVWLGTEWVCRVCVGTEHFWQVAGVCAYEHQWRKQTFSPFFHWRSKRKRPKSIINSNFLLFSTLYFLTPTQCTELFSLTQATAEVHMVSSVLSLNFFFLLIFTCIYQTNTHTSTESQKVPVKMGFTRKAPTTETTAQVPSNRMPKRMGENKKGKKPNEKLKHYRARE